MIRGGVIRDVTVTDAAALAAIYAPYVRETAVTFEEEAPDAPEMAARIAATIPRNPWLVIESEGAIAGYAYGRPYHPRSAYRWTCETGIYLARERRGHGIGRALYEALIARLAAQGFVAAMAVIAVPNPESTRFHEKLGFRAVGLMSEIGFKLGRWHDVGYYQRDLAPRRTPPAELAAL